MHLAQSRDEFALESGGGGGVVGGAGHEVVDGGLEFAREAGGGRGGRFGLAALVAGDLGEVDAGALGELRLREFAALAELLEAGGGCVLA